MSMSCNAQHDALPDDVAALKALIHEQQSTIAQLKRANDGLTHRMELLLRRLYGRSSERIDASQLLLFGQAVAGQDAQADKSTDENASAPRPSRKRNGRGHGRRPLPEDLPRHRIEHPMDPVELTCPCCGDPRQRIGEWISEQLEYTPASFFVLQHVRGKYACKQCEEGGVATAETSSPQVIEQGLPGPGLVAHVITSKYCDHLPLYRQEQMYTRHGVSLARSTMCGWLKEAAKLIEPLHALMCERIRQSKVMHTDDTPLPVQQTGRGKTKTGRLWVYLGDPRHPYTIYEYTPTRERDGPMNWLKDFTGYLQADAFGGYDGIYARSGGGEVIEVACWAHARRKFYDARLSDPARAHHAMGLIRQLYDIEAQAASMDATERYALRQREAVGVLDALEAWLKQEQEVVLPKAPIAQAIQYAMNHWDALRRYPWCYFPL